MLRTRYSRNQNGKQRAASYADEMLRDYLGKQRCFEYSDQEWNSAKANVLWVSSEEIQDLPENEFSVNTFTDKEAEALEREEFLLRDGVKKHFKWLEISYYGLFLCIMVSSYFLLPAEIAWAVSACFIAVIAGAGVLVWKWKHRGTGC